MYNGVYSQEIFAYQHDMLKKWLKKKIDGRSIADGLIEKNIRSVCIYGVLGLGELAYSELSKAGIKVSCFSDKSFKDYPLGYDGIPVVSFDSIPPDIDAVIVTPEFYFREICELLLESFVPMEKIISLAMLVD